MPPVYDVVILGSGIAGSLMAHRLAQTEKSCILLESRDSVCDGASGNRIANVIPQFTKEKTALSLHLNRCFSRAVEFYQQFPQFWNPCGTAFLFQTDRMKEKLLRGKEYLLEDSEVLESLELQKKSGVNSPFPALWLGTSGYLRASEFCKKILEESKIEIRTSARVQSFKAQDDFWELGFSDRKSLRAKSLILCASYESFDFPELQALPQRKVRGQVIEFSCLEILKNLRSMLCFDGYLSPAVDGRHLMGGSYRHEAFDEPPSQMESESLVSKLQSIWPELPDPDIQAVRARVRHTTPDHAPIVGLFKLKEPELPQKIYLFCGLGSRGFTWGPYLSELLFKELTVQISREESHFLKYFSPERFVRS